MRLPLLCEKSGPILLVLVGLTAGWEAGNHTYIFVTEETAIKKIKYVYVATSY